MHIVLLLLGLMPPGRIKVRMLRRLGGYHIDTTARLLPLILFRVRHFEAGPNTYVGPTAFVNVHRVVIEGDAVIGHWNWISSVPGVRNYAKSTSLYGAGTFHLGRGAAVTSRHYIDCSGGVAVGRFSIVAGVRSTILSHQIDIERSEQQVRPVRIGAYCFIGSNTKIVPGASVPDRGVVAMGSTVVGSLDSGGVLYAGVPARAVRGIESAQFFRREVSRVDFGRDPHL